MTCVRPELGWALTHCCLYAHSEVQRIISPLSLELYKICTKRVINLVSSRDCKGSLPNHMGQSSNEKAVAA